MNEQLHAGCHIVQLPAESEAEAARRAIEENIDNCPRPVPEGLGVELASLAGKLWKPGRTLRVFFRNGTTTDQNRVMSIAKQWEAHGNIFFTPVGTPAEGDIRIEFITGGGGSSYIGTDAVSVPKEKPTMWLGLLGVTDPHRWGHVVLHEFGHALGCVHEHQSPSATIPWIKRNVYNDCATWIPPWSKKDVDDNILNQHHAGAARFNTYDPQSIMIYEIKPHWVSDPAFATTWNSTLSASDQSFIAILYPRRFSLSLSGRVQNWTPTGIEVRKGQYLTVRASGEIFFWGGRYPRNPDGRDEFGRVEEPAWRYDNGFGRHPAPMLRKNSLVFRVNDWQFQGGSHITVQVMANGALEMSNNDNKSSDNDGEWRISLQVS